MQQWKRVSAAIAALAFSAGAFAQAATSEGGTWSNFYVGGGYGQSHWLPGCPSTVPTCDDTDFGLRVFAGYHINRIFSAEIAFVNLGKVTGPNMEIHGKAWEASGIAAWPLSSSISVFGRLGAYRGVVKGGGIFANLTESNYYATYGFGGQYDFTQNLGARLEWQAYPGVGGSTITDSDIHILSLSALWRFR